MILDRGRFVLDGTDVVPVDDPILWARWYEAADVTVAFDRIGSRIAVSTVFLGLDHSFPRAPRRPLVFETAIFDGGGIEFDNPDRDLRPGARDA